MAPLAASSCCRTWPLCGHHSNGLSLFIEHGVSISCSQANRSADYSLLPRKTDQALDFGHVRRQSMTSGAEQAHVTDVAAYLHGDDMPGPSWQAAYAFGLLLITAVLSSCCQRGKNPGCNETVYTLRQVLMILRSLISLCYALCKTS